MKNKISLLLCLLATMFCMTILVSAEETTSILSGCINSECKTGTYNISAEPGSKITLQLRVSSSQVMNIIRIPWTMTNNITVTASALPITNGDDEYQYSLTYKDGSEYAENLVLSTNENISSTQPLPVVKLVIKVSDSFSNNDTATLHLGNGFITNDNGRFNLQGMDLKINYKAPSGGGDEGGPSAGQLDPDTDKVTVTFETNGGTKISPITIAKGSKIEALQNPTKSGYKMVGWYTDKALTKAFDYTSTINSNMTLYAKWAEAIPTSGPVISETTDDGDGLDLGYGIILPKDEDLASDVAGITPKKNGDPVVTDTTATIKFDAGIDKWTCYVYRSSKADSDFELITKEPIECTKNTSYTDEGLTPDTPYYYRVRLVGGKNISDAIGVKTLTAGTGGGSDGEEQQEKKKGNVGPGNTGALTPVAIVLGLSGAFILIKKYYKENSFFSKL